VTRPVPTTIYRNASLIAFAAFLHTSDTTRAT
jgi:hypothetical protein